MKIQEFYIGNLDELRFDRNTGKPIRDRSKDITPFVRAFKNLDSGAEPKSDIEWAVKLVMDGASIESPNLTYKLEDDYGVPRGHGKSVYDLMRQTPSIEELEKAARDKEVTAQQQQQSDQLSALQHNMTVQQLIRQNQLADADAEAMLKMDVEARQAIRERMQAMELESKERLAKVEIDIRNSKEPEAERAQALEMAKQTHVHELEVIKVTAEGEYKKAKLEADYQIKIKELENIDNAGERQNRLDVINTEKQKELAIIDKETSAAIAKMQAGADINRQESDTRIREEFMMTFKPVWGNLLDKASQVGKTVGQNISAVMGALGRLARPIMPKAESKDSISYFRNLVDNMQASTTTPTKNIPNLQKEFKVGQTVEFGHFLKMDKHRVGKIVNIDDHLLTIDVDGELVKVHIGNKSLAINIIDEKQV